LDEEIDNQFNNYRENFISEDSANYYGNSKKQENEYMKSV